MNHCHIFLFKLNIKYAKTWTLFSNNVNTTIRKYSSRAFIWVVTPLGFVGQFRILKFSWFIVKFTLCSELLLHSCNMWWPFFIIARTSPQIRCACTARIDACAVCACASVMIFIWTAIVSSIKSFWLAIRQGGQTGSVMLEQKISEQRTGTR